MLSFQRSEGTKLLLYWDDFQNAHFLEIGIFLLPDNSYFYSNFSATV